MMHPSPNVTPPGDHGLRTNIATISDPGRRLLIGCRAARLRKKTKQGPKALIERRCALSFTSSIFINKCIDLAAIIANALFIEFDARDTLIINTTAANPVLAPVDVR